MKRGVWCGVVGLCLWWACCAQAQTQSSTQKFEAATGRIIFLDGDTFLYNRPKPVWYPRREFVSDGFGKAVPFDKAFYDESLNAVSEVVHLGLSRDELVQELKDPDARVRTMALVALFAREDAHDLPQIVASINDKAPTFPTHDGVGISAMGGIPTLQDQTVGGVAARMVHFYLTRAEYNSVIHRSPGSEPGFPTYWKERKDRAFCASWFALKLDRASRSTSLITPEFVADIRRVRAQIDALPRLDRNWTMLYLGVSTPWFDGDVFVSDADLERAARELGPARLLRVLKNQSVSSDPDIAPGNANKGDVFWTLMKKFILQHARQLLLPSQVEALLAQEKQERVPNTPDGPTAYFNSFVSPLWFVAAADLDAPRARSILQTGWKQFQGPLDADNQTTLAVALAKKENRDDWPFLLEWFFVPLDQDWDGSPKEWDGTSSGGRQPAFVSGLVEKPHRSMVSEPQIQPPSPVLRQLLGHIVNDPRFDNSQFLAVSRVLKVINASQPQPIADEQKFSEDAWSGNPQSLKAQAALKAMKDKLRATSAQWSR